MEIVVREQTEFAEIFFDDLSHRARYLETILKEELDILKIN